MGGSEFVFYGRTCGDAVKFIEANFAHFATWVRHEEEFGRIHVYKVDGRYVSLAGLNHGVAREIEIVEAIPGSGGLGKILIGAALIGSAFIPGLPVLTVGASSIALSSVALSIGLSLLLGGIASLLTPKKGGSTSSTSLGGSLSTTPQGRAIPVAFGECYINLKATGIVLSAGVDVQDIAAGGGKGGKGK
jgi:predicted phage tail protein